MQKLEVSLERRFAVASFLSLVLPGVQAADSIQQNVASNYKPFRIVNVPEDGQRVLVFFDFSCPFCAQYHEQLSRWSLTVPKSVKTLFVPVVNTAEVTKLSRQIVAANCYYSAFSIASQQQMIAFLSSVYESAQEGFNLMAPAPWAKAVKVAKIDPVKFQKTVAAQRFESQIQMSAWKVAQYALRATPSVSVGGKYVMTPDDVMGDMPMFFNILNGLTSEII